MSATGVGLIEDPSGPRLTAELMRMNRTLGELASSQKSTEQKVDEVHKAVFIGNHKPGIIQWLMKHDSQIGRLLRIDTEQRKKTLKTVGFSGLGLSALVLALKLVAYLVTGHWPTMP